MSSRYVAIPVISRGSSQRRMPRPTKVWGLIVVVAMLRTPLSRGRFHGVHDVLIPGAAAEVPLEAVPDLLFGGARVIGKELPRCEDHAGRAEATLQPVLVPESFLQGIELS